MTLIGVEVIIGSSDNLLKSHRGELAMLKVPINRQTVADRLAEELLRLIGSGRYSVGDRIPTESQLMEMFGVGRSSVREAVQRLVSLGLLSVRPGRGAVLVNLPYAVKSDPLPMRALREKRMEDLLVARKTLEMGVVDLVVTEATEQDFAALQGLVDDIKRRLRTGEPVARQGAEFHLELARAGGNWIMLRMVQTVFDVLWEHGELVEGLPGWREQEYHLHQRLLDVLRTRDREAARREMTTHLEVSFAALRQALAMSEKNRQGNKDPSAPLT